MAPSPQFAIEMHHIRKTFPNGVVANSDVSFQARPGTLHAIIGENGAGKSTLMNILYGRYVPDAGEILLDGKPITFRNPREAIQNGIGMVTQHTTLVPAFTLLENIILGAEPSSNGIVKKSVANEKIKTICSSLGIEFNPGQLAESASITVQQKVEIVKALYRGARILILDEPTATLGPIEADALYKLMRNLADSGTTVLFITHKLREVISHSTCVTVLRNGASVGQHLTSNVKQELLLNEMLGTAAAQHTAGFVNSIPTSKDADNVLNVQRITMNDNTGFQRVRDVDLTIQRGEVVGIAGLDGSGQRELSEAIAGLRPLVSGNIQFCGRDISNLSSPRRLSAGITYVPENRHRDGLIGHFSIAENLILGREREIGVGGGRILNVPKIKSRGDQAVLDHKIRARNGSDLAESLSGGNQQKVVLARALDQNPRLIILMQPTRGLDVEATRHIYEMIANARNNGAAVLLFSLDLDEILAQSDRIGVMFNGALSIPIPTTECTITSLGAQMTGTVI